jgi:hypothetical protein
MTVVFDEVVGDVRPDDDGESDNARREHTPARSAIDVDELRRTLERARRRNARLAAD